MSKYTYIIDDFIKMCPEFITRWEEHLKFWEDDIEYKGIFLDMAEVAQFIVDQYEVERTEKFSEIFTQIEKYLDSNDEELIGIITVGLLEDIQTIASNRKFGYRVFEEWLKPRSLKSWYGIEKTWEGKSSLMDVIKDEVTRNKG